MPGAAWQNGTQPCGGGAEQRWKGLVCDEAGNVTAIQLAGLGLAGTLPTNLSALVLLDTLNLSGNALTGSLPPAWLLPTTFDSLLAADLGGNKLSGAGTGACCAPGRP